MVTATVALMDVITNTPRKLNTAANTIDFFADMDRVDTIVAIAFGASVQPLTKMTPIIKITTMKRAGISIRLCKKSLN
jgi:intracellular sulfur oxidation DsrE/DsrF family protein